MLAFALGSLFVNNTDLASATCSVSGEGETGRKSAAEQERGDEGRARSAAPHSWTARARTRTGIMTPCRRVLAVRAATSASISGSWTDGVRGPAGRGGGPRRHSLQLNHRPSLLGNETHHFQKPSTGRRSFKVAESAAPRDYSRLTVVSWLRPPRLVASSTPRLPEPIHTPLPRPNLPNRRPTPPLSTPPRRARHPEIYGQCLRWSAGGRGPLGGPVPGPRQPRHRQRKD